MTTKTLLIQQCFTKNLDETFFTSLPRGSKSRVLDFLRRQHPGTLKDWASNYEELRRQVKKYLSVVVGGVENRHAEKAEEQKRGEYAKTIAQWVWKLHYLKDEEAIFAELMKAEVSIENLHGLATTVELIVINGMVSSFFFFFFLVVFCYGGVCFCVTDA